MGNKRSDIHAIDAWNQPCRCRWADLQHASTALLNSRIRAIPVSSAYRHGAYVLCCTGWYRAGQRVASAPSRPNLAAPQGETTSSPLLLCAANPLCDPICCRSRCRTLGQQYWVYSQIDTGVCRFRNPNLAPKAKPQQIKRQNHGTDWNPPPSIRPSRHFKAEVFLLRHPVIPNVARILGCTFVQHSIVPHGTVLFVECTALALKRTPSSSIASPGILFPKASASTKCFLGKISLKLHFFIIPCNVTSRCSPIDWKQRGQDCQSHMVVFYASQNVLVSFLWLATT